MLRIFKSPSYKKVLSQRAVSLWKDPAHRERMRITSEYHSRRLKKLWRNSEYRKHMLRSNHRIHHSKEVRRRLSQISKERWADPVMREKIITGLKGITVSEKTREKIRRSFTKARRAEIAKQCKAQWKRGMFKGNAAWASSLWKNPEFREKRIRLARAEMNKRWRDPIKSEKMIQALISGIQQRPTKPEIEISKILNQLFPGRFKYVGDWKFSVDRLCPDFVSCTGKMQIIEMFGDYWHRGESGKPRIRRFAKHGYQALIIWERELKNIPLLKRRLMRFCGAK